MDLSVGTKRITNRKRVQPAEKKKEVRPAIQKANLPTPVYGETFDIQKAYSKAVEEETAATKLTFKEKEIMASRSYQQRMKLPKLEITDINYNILSHEELEKLAVFEATNSEDAGLRSVNDPRGGTVDNTPCASCELDNLECPGHMGIINLNVKIIHPSFLQETLNILSSVCNSCGGLLLPKDKIVEKGFLDLTGSDRLKKIAEASANVPCRRNYKKEEENITPCIPNPIYMLNKLKDTGKVFYTRQEKKGGKKGEVTENIRSIEEVEAILNAISPEDAELLGFGGNSHPSRFIMKSIAVIPLCARAPVYQDGNIMKDDLTSIYQEIIRNNNDLLDKNLKEVDKEKKIKTLIFAIEHMINNSDKKYKQGQKKIYQSIKDRIQGKEALIREAIMGKRVNFSARTVLGPDPTLKFGQIRIPRIMAPYLTQHEIVTSENRMKLMSLLRNARITYITPSTGKLMGKRVKVNEKIQNEHDLIVGDEIDRWLQDGDYVIFNRQPTLHKQSFMGYEVVLGDALTIGLHLGYTRQHNAD